MIKIIIGAGYLSHNALILEKEMVTPAFFIEKYMERGAWWATVPGVKRVIHNWAATYTHTHTH